eukprot:scaffold472810_cov31-Prasinocladus_malaysianus.AAC.1
MPAVSFCRRDRRLDVWSYVFLYGSVRMTRDQHCGWALQRGVRIQHWPPRPKARVIAPETYGRGRRVQRSWKSRGRRCTIGHGASRVLLAKIQTRVDVPYDFGRRDELCRRCELAGRC